MQTEVKRHEIQGREVQRHAWIVLQDINRKAQLSAQPVVGENSRLTTLAWTAPRACAGLYSNECVCCLCSLHCCAISVGAIQNHVADGHRPRLGVSLDLPNAGAGSVINQCDAGTPDLRLSKENVTWSYPNRTVRLE